jgi:capsular polysaccharide biosynthesis protein
VFQQQVPILMNVDNVQILTEAKMSANPQPVSPNKTLNMAIAFVLGAMVGVGLAFLLEYLDNTIKNEQDVEKHLELPVLGVISQMSDEAVRTQSSPSARVNRKRGGSIGA